MDASLGPALTQRLAGWLAVVFTLAKHEVREMAMQTAAAAANNAMERRDNAV